MMGTSSEYEFLIDGSIEIMPSFDYGFMDIKAELSDAFQDQHLCTKSHNSEGEHKQILYFFLFFIEKLILLYIFIVLAVIFCEYI